jgi:sigma-B regulation protein RsbU (phosphoserine phosphatase)
MSLFNRDGLRTASVRVHTPIKLLEMTRQEFDALLSRQPALAYDMVRVMSQRLADIENVTVRDLREKNIQLQEAYEELKAAQAQLIESEKLKAELEIARRIQRNILPRQQPRIPGFDFGMLIEPMSSVGGDFFDFIPLGKNKLGIALGDVSGHGVPAALFMALTYSLLRGEVGRASTPGEAVRNANYHLLNMNETSMFVTLLYGVLDLKTRQFNYVRAGHDQPLVMDGAGQVIPQIYGLGQALGLFEKPPLDEQSVILPPGGLMLLYTDGVVEAENLNGEPFGLERLQDALRSCDWSSAQCLCEGLLDAVRSHIGSPSPQDDITLVAVRLE